MGFQGGEGGGEQVDVVHAHAHLPGGRNTDGKADIVGPKYTPTDEWLAVRLCHTGPCCTKLVHFTILSNKSDKKG